MRCNGPRISTAPAAKLLLASGTSSNGSKSYFSPRPSHSGHIPCGLLKLNNCGEGGSKLSPQWAQAYFADSSNSSTQRCGSSAAGPADEGLAPAVLSVSGLDSTNTSNVPSLSRSACSTASATRLRALASRTIRSTTISMVCLRWRSKRRSSLSRASCPSTRARRYPRLRISANKSLYSPFCSRITGASTNTRLRGGKAQIRATI
ncbi:hypothetical protein HRbin36_01919 [bacterium HR36]|nr:hypothetical protein HRbin36_01919 [bacterium HR36]